MDRRATIGWVAPGLIALLLAEVATARQQEAVDPPQPEAQMRSLFEHVRADVANRVIEIDGMVPIDCHDEETPEVFLEVVACSPGTKEHEALVLTRAKPSHIHAALLAIGLEAGKPGAWTWDSDALTVEAPEGPRLDVEIEYTNEDGRTITADIRTWIVDVESEVNFEPGWLFAGSRMVTYREQEVYDADGTGLIVGLTTFGSEVVACDKVISHEAEVTEPEWIANRDLVPAYKTSVVLRLKAVDEEETDEAPPSDPE